MLLLGALIALGLLAYVFPAVSRGPATDRAGCPGCSSDTPLSKTTLFLPVVGDGWQPPVSSIFGVDWIFSQPGSGFQQIAQAGVGWMRLSWTGVNWALVEPSPGARDWSQLSALDKALLTLSSQGIRPIVTVRGAPGWAQSVPGYECGPVDPSQYGAFAGFMHDLVSRYSASPYNVHDWEMWDEPDIDPELVNPNSFWGCWGVEGDEDYGGRAYSQMLSAVYPVIKAADPQAQVFVGGLLLFCNPLGWCGLFSWKFPQRDPGGWERREFRRRRLSRL
jgi:hypothetical protein